MAVSEIRQYLYCPRIVYWRRVLRLGGVETPLMRRGREGQARALRDALQLVPLRGCKVERDLILFSERLGLWGRLDGLLICGDRAYPLEVKFASPARSHKVQLAAYGMLVEERIGRRVDQGYLYYPGGEGLIEVEGLRRMRGEVLRIVGELSRIVEEEILPPPTANRAKCRVCEHYSACKGL